VPKPARKLGAPKIATIAESAVGTPGSPPEPTLIIDSRRVPAMALADLRTGLAHHELWFAFALHDIRQRFRRSMLGPFWITISTGVMVLALGLIFGSIFNSNPADFIPYLAAGIIFWSFITSAINESCTTFIKSANDVRSVPVPLSVHFYRTFAGSFLVFAHNLAILAVVIVVFQRWPTWEWLLLIPGFALFCIVLGSGSLVLAIISTRFRDVPQVIASLLQVVFFVTPIFWSVDQIPRHVAVITLNPVYHLIEVVRAPLLGRIPALETWAAVSGMAVAGLVVAFLLYRRAYPRIAYWV
jgi:ABC-type polysaccharide/polyol phosphate export permease